MPLPFVSRSHYREVVADLREQVARANEERLKVWDLFAYRATGEKLFYPSPEEPKAPVVPQEHTDDEILEARRELGPRATSRAVVELLGKKNSRRFVETHKSAVMANEADKVLNKTIDEGRAAVQKAAE